MKLLLPSLPLLAVMVGLNPAVSLAHDGHDQSRFARTVSSSHRHFEGARRSSRFDRGYRFGTPAFDDWNHQAPPSGIPSYGHSHAEPRPVPLESSIRGWYLTYLGREPELAGYASWIHHFHHAGASLMHVEIGIMSSEECFARCQRDPHAYVSFLLHQVMGRECTHEEVHHWVSVFLNRYHGDRSEFCQALLLSLPPH